GLACRRCPPTRGDREARVTHSRGCMTGAGTVMQGKTCVLTGGTSGIGRETAVALAGLGARLALVCRDRMRGEETAAEIAARTGSRDVVLHLADLSARPEVRRGAGAALSAHPQIPVLVK